MKKTLSSALIIVMLLLTFTSCGHEHEFGEWKTVTDAECAETGIREHVCECGETETEIVKATGHSFDEKIIVKSTCTEDGKLEKTCTVCGTKEIETIKSTGHKFVAATVFAPKTCTECGKTEGEALSKVVEVGDKITSENHSFVVENVAFSGSLKEKKGNVTYSYFDGFFLAIKLKFTNLSTEDFEDWGSNRISDVYMKYQDKYTYNGESWCPADYIVPLSSDTVYIVYEVPASMSKDTENSICATFTIDGEVYSMIIQ